LNYEEYKEKEKKRIERAIAYMEAGVEFADINTVYIDEGVKIGKGTFIGPCVTIEGNTVIGSGCMIYQNTRIKDAEIGDNVEIQSSVILESSVGSGTKVGPFAYMRPDSHVGENCKIGDFVEIKNSNFGNGSKSAHLTYIGDADVGEGVNLGCGIVFVNYDGNNKFRTKVGNNAFIGCNTNLVAPVEVGDDTYIAAGSTITKNVPKDALGIAREKQTNIEGWAAKRGLYRKDKK
jgi:bifunctional UDP-N-acetylglucosamine pyrophosphorylase/glucosamine-1-phosphate N-acetyltransferase